MLDHMSDLDLIVLLVELRPDYRLALLKTLVEMNEFSSVNQN